MVVVDSSVLIPLSKVGRLNLIEENFDEIVTTECIYEEVVVEGKERRGVSKLKECFDDWISIENFDNQRAEEISELEGITTADASLLVLSEDTSSILLTNDRALILIAKSRNVEYYWLTTLLLKSTKEGKLGKNEAKELLRGLLSAGMNLDTRVYSEIIDRIERF